MYEPIKGWEMYSINPQGDVKRYNRILKTHLWHGKPRVKLSKEGKTACEIDEQYFADATERLRIAQSQLTMF